MAGTFTGGVTLTGLKPGETTLELKAGDVTRTIPVTVYEEDPSNLWRYPDLPVTSNGVTFTRDGAGVHAKGTVQAGQYANIHVNAELEGRYRLSPATGDSNPYAFVGTLGGESAVLGKGVAEAEIPDGPYRLNVSVKGPASVDATITPVLTRID